MTRIKNYNTQATGKIIFSASPRKGLGLDGSFDVAGENFYGDSSEEHDVAAGSDMDIQLGR